MRERERIHMSRLMVVLLALAVTIPAVVKGRPSDFHDTLPAFLVYSSGRTMIHVDGAVRHPGIYVVGANILADSVIVLAGLVRSQKKEVCFGSGKMTLVTGSAVHVIEKDAKNIVVTVGSIPVAQRIILGIPLDLQSMERDDFERLPGIGPVLAQRIVTYRQNNDGKLGVNDLLSVEGIGEKKHNVLKMFFN